MPFNPRGLSGPYYLSAAFLPLRLWFYSGIDSPLMQIPNAPSYGVEPGDVIIARPITEEGTLEEIALLQVYNTDPSTKTASMHEFGSLVAIGLPADGLYTDGSPYTNPI